MIRLLFLLTISIILTSCHNSTKQNTTKDTVNQTLSVIDTTKNDLLPKKDTSRQGVPTNYIGECFLLDSGKVMIYDAVKGSVVDSISNDYQMEDYYEIQIIKQQKDWFKINANAIKKEKSGWVKIKPNYFGVYAANYTDSLTVYREPDKESNKVHTFPEYFTEPFNVLGCKQGWIQVSLKKDGRTYKGWVPKESTCPNPYSTCN